MGKYVTENGFDKRTFEQLTEYYTVVFKSVFGEDIDLNPEQGAGALLDYLATTDAETWDTANDIYTANDVRQAVGVSLDNNIGALINVWRQDASKAEVQKVAFFGDEGAVVTAGNRVRNATNVTADRRTFDVDADVTITKANAREAWYSVDLQAGPVNYSITLNGDAYDVFGLFPTEATAIDGFVNLIEAELPQKFNAERVDTDDGSRLRVWWNASVPSLPATDGFSMDSETFMVIDKFGSPGSVTALLEGFVSLGPGFINEIATGVSGWSGVYNTDSKLVGTGVGIELDPSYRQRLQIGISSSGLATEDAIRRTILNDVTAVATCIVRSNRTLTALAAGAPTNSQAAKSFQSYVDGIGAFTGTATANQQLLADAIFKAAPAGIEIFGTEGPIVVVDDDGEDQNTYYSIVQGVSIEVAVSRDLYEEFQSYPIDGDDLIRDACVEYARINWVLGKDVITSRLATPIYVSVPGVGEVQIRARIKGVGNYSTDTIPIDSVSVATLEATDILVESIP